MFQRQIMTFPPWQRNNFNVINVTTYAKLWNICNPQPKATIVWCIYFYNFKYDISIWYKPALALVDANSCVRTTKKIPNTYRTPRIRICVTITAPHTIQDRLLSLSAVDVNSVARECKGVSLGLSLVWMDWSMSIFHFHVKCFPWSFISREEHPKRLAYVYLFFWRHRGFRAKKNNLTFVHVRWPWSKVNKLVK